MARTQSSKYPEIRDNILKQAARLFAQKGYPGTTIIDLAEACASSRGALYHYFDSKEAILFHILDGHVNNLLGEVEEAAVSGADPQEQARAVIDTIVATNAGSRHEQVVLLNHLDALSPEQQKGIVAKQRRITETLGDILIRIDARHRLTTGNKKVYTMMLLGMINYTFAWYDPEGAVPPSDYARMAADVFIRGFSGK